jgi:hypothetical protein
LFLQANAERRITSLFVISPVESATMYYKKNGFYLHGKCLSRRVNIASYKHRRWKIR